MTTKQKRVKQKQTQQQYVELLERKVDSLIKRVEELELFRTHMTERYERDHNRYRITPMVVIDIPMGRAREERDVTPQPPSLPERTNG